VAAFTFTVSVAPSGAARAHNTWAEDAEMRAWLGARAVDVIDGAERAEVARVEPKHLDAPGGREAPPNVGGFPLVGSFKPLAADLLEGFQGALLDRGTYEFPPPRTAVIPLCGGFQPGVALRFWPKRKGKPVEVLLCFTCTQLAAVAGSGADSSTPVIFRPGRLTLLRLAGAALPDFAELARMLAAEQAERARELQFESIFPPDVIIAFERVSLDSDDGAAEAVGQLRRHVSGKALFALAARALGAKGNDLHSLDKATKALYAAVRSLSAAEVAAGLEAIRGDQVALAGAGELFFESGVARRLPEPARFAWVPTLLEALLARNANGHCAMIHFVSSRVGKPLVPLLVRVLRGQVPLASWASRSFQPDEPSGAGCALMALAATDEDAARVGLATWRPASPLDALAVRAARVRLGEEGALDGALLATKSPTVSAVTLDGIEAHPSRHGLDVLAASGLDPGSGAGVGGERVFSSLTGATTSKSDDDERLAELRAWWAAHRDAWRPPARAPDAGAP
jgi:hypothetical protein